MTDCAAFKVTWFGEPVPNIFGILNILNFGGEGPFTEEIILPEILRLLPIISCDVCNPVLFLSPYISTPGYLGLFLEPKCWLKINKRLPIE